MATGNVSLLETFQKHIEDMRNLSLCKICIKPFYEPFILPCGHSYCYSCLSSWFGGSSNRRKQKNCPDCRAEVNIQPSPNYLLRDLVHMFINRTELLPEDETVQEHQEAKTEEAELLAKDRAGPGLFKGAFISSSALRLTSRYLHSGRSPIRDPIDHVDRCPTCTWELEDGYCIHCGYSAFADDRWSDFDSDDSMDLIPLDSENHWPRDRAPISGPPRMRPSRAPFSSDEESGDRTPYDYDDEDDENDTEDMDSFIDDDDDDGIDEDEESHTANTPTTRYIPDVPNRRRISSSSFSDGGLNGPVISHQTISSTTRNPSSMRNRRRISSSSFSDRGITNTGNIDLDINPRPASNERAHDDDWVSSDESDRGSSVYHDSSEQHRGVSEPSSDSNDSDIVRPRIGNRTTRTRPIVLSEDEESKAENENEDEESDDTATRPPQTAEIRRRRLDNLRNRRNNSENRTLSTIDNVRRDNERRSPMRERASVRGMNVTRRVAARVH